VSLRYRIESDLQYSTKDWGLPVEIINLQGVKQTLSANDNTKTLKALQILYDTRTVDPGTGLDVVAKKPIVVMRITDLDAVPARGWAVRIPVTPIENASLVTHWIERASEDGASIGFIRLYCGKVVQE
jgi:hypothetical protein